MKSLEEYYTLCKQDIQESLQLNEKMYGKAPKQKQSVKDTDEDENYPSALEDIIDDLELEIESYFDDHDEVMQSTLNDHIIESIKAKIKEETFDEWDKNYNHEIIRDVLDKTKEDKSKIIENAIACLFSKESRVLDEIAEDLDDAKNKHAEFKSTKIAELELRKTNTEFDLTEDEQDDEDTEEEGAELLDSVKSLESQLTKPYYVREYKKLFDKHFKGVSGKIKRISR